MFAKTKLEAAGWNIEQAINKHFAEEQAKAADNVAPKSELEQLQSMGFENSVRPLQFHATSTPF